MAKPFPIAAVVFPAASSLSVRCLTYLCRPAISAIPPALSDIGPYPSIERATGRQPIMPSAAKATPYIDANLNEMYMVAQMQNIGTIVEA